MINTACIVNTCGTLLKPITDSNILDAPVFLKIAQILHVHWFQINCNSTTYQLNYQPNLLNSYFCQQPGLRFRHIKASLGRILNYVIAPDAIWQDSHYKEIYLFLLSLVQDYWYKVTDDHNTHTPYKGCFYRIRKIRRTTRKLRSFVRHDSRIFTPDYDSEDESSDSEQLWKAFNNKSGQSLNVGRRQNSARPLDLESGLDSKLSP